MLSSFCYLTYVKLFLENVNVEFDIWLEILLLFCERIKSDFFRVKSELLLDKFAWVLLELLY